MNAGSWALLGFTLLAAGEVARELELRQAVRLLIFAAATVALAIAFAQHHGWT